ncbi:MAG: ATP-binding cassette domain-containing protein [Gammaproteobacteria bacterium]|nr:ATP-binding cassette domain-containing protein [Gammaproteobacteria bacterium]
MIRVQEIGKAYRSGRRQVEALDEVSCTVQQGETLAVVGKSGSGKTTLLNCIGGLERPDSGRIACLGENIHELSRRALSMFQREHLGFVFQFGNLLSYLTVHENIEFPLALNRVPRRERDLRVSALLERIGLGNSARALPGELSGGEVQRISFARAIAHRPQILLADEPTASLDSQTAHDLVQLMLDVVRDQAASLIVTTHDPVVIELTDSIMHLRDGKVVEESRTTVL